MNTAMIRVSSARDARMLWREAMRMRVGPGTHVVIDIKTSRREAQVAWFGRLRAIRRSCGCASGALGVALALPLSIVMIDPPDLSVRVGACAGAVVGSAIAGKLIGLLVRHIRFLLLCCELVRATRRETTLVTATEKGAGT